MSGTALNTDPPDVRCGMCGGRCRPWYGHPGWIECRRCAWSSHHPKRRGVVWCLRVLLGWESPR